MPIATFVCGECMKSFKKGVLSIQNLRSYGIGSNCVRSVISSDGIQNFKNRFSFVSNLVTTGSLILESPFAAVV